jgi:hypothetical protein
MAKTIEEQVRDGMLAAFRDPNFASAMAGAANNQSAGSGRRRRQTNPAGQRTTQQQAGVTAISSATGINAGMFNQLVDMTSDLGNLITGTTEATLTFLTDQQFALREQYDYAFSMRDSIGGFTVEALAQKDAIDGLAGTVITTGEEILQVASGQITEDMKAEYGEVADVLYHSFEEPKLAASAFRSTFNAIASETPRLLETLNKVQLAEITSYKKNLGLQDREIKDILQRQYAYTGEATSDVLGEIGEVSMRMSKATGLGANQIKQDIITVTTDVQRFGDIGVDAAGRLSAALAQVGLDVNILGKMVDDFSSFDKAANKMSDLSSMFNIQLDAMEMTYLANEDQEEFFFRMREEILNSGVDIDNMSHARARALSDTLGMNITQMKTFLRDGEMVVDQEELTQAGQMELEFEGVTNALENFGDKMTRSLQPVETQLESIRKGQLVPLREEALAVANAMGTQYNNVFSQINIASDDSLKALSAVYKGLESISLDTEGATTNIAANINNAFNTGITKTLDALEKTTGELPEFKSRQVVEYEIKASEDLTNLLATEQRKTEEFKQGESQKLQQFLESSGVTQTSIDSLVKQLEGGSKTIEVTLDGDVLTKVVIENFEAGSGEILTVGNNQ